MSYELHCGDNRDVLDTLPRQSVHLAVMGPPYYGQRTYTVNGQAPPPGTIGLKETPYEQYLTDMKAFFEKLVPVMFPSGWIGVSLSSIFQNRELIELTEEIRPFLNRLGWIRHQRFIWNKPWHIPDGGRALRQSMNDTEHFDWYINRRGRPFYDPLGMLDANGKPFKQVWTIAPDRARKYYRPQDGQLIRHPATSPVELFRRAIRGCTSAKGCCPICRTPWIRVYEHMGDPRKFEREQEEDSYTGASNRTVNGTVPSFASTRYINKGFKKGCACATDGVIPCTVLDPFSGTGQAGVAAVSRHRHYVGIEINPDFHYIGEQRLADAQSRANLRDLFEDIQNEAAEAAAEAQRETAAMRESFDLVMNQ